MNPAGLPDAIISKMSERDRKALKLKTTEERFEEANASAELAHQEKICEYLDLKGIPYWHSATHRKTTTKKGTPDFCIVYSGHALIIECKGPRGCLSESQEKFIAQLENARTQTHITRSSAESLTLIKAWLESLQ
jgi:VRR-NUC domain-containing protein